MHKILTLKQISVLELLAQDKFFTDSFYLTGGTALAAFYLGHRYSEDLDFFTTSEIEPVPLDVFVKTIQDKVGAKTRSYQNIFNRNIFFLKFDNEILKIEFTHFPFPQIEKPRIEMGLRIDSLLDIAVNKLFTIYQRTAARDYIDLYFICRDNDFEISNLILKAKAKFDWHIDLVQLGTQFEKAKDAHDLPRMIKPIDHSEWQNFFLQEATKLKSEIIK